MRQPDLLELSSVFPLCTLASQYDTWTGTIHLPVFVLKYLSSSPDMPADSPTSKTAVKLPGTPSLDSKPRQGSAPAAPGATDYRSKSKLFGQTPLGRSTGPLNQDLSSAPPFLTDPKDPITALPSELVDLNLALGSLDLDFADPKSTDKETTDQSSSTNNENDEEPYKDEGTQQQIYGPPLLPQPLPFFPLNEFGQPLHGPFSQPSSGAHSPIPWTSETGQTHFGIGSNAMDGISMHPPGMIPMRPFEFQEAMGPAGPHLQSGPVHPLEMATFNNFGAMKERHFNNNFHGMENLPSNGPQQPHNNHVWPVLNNSRGVSDRGFDGANMPSHPNQHNNGQRGDRRYLYYGNRNNHNNNKNGKRMGGNRPRSEDASKFDNAKLDDFVGQIYSLCKDQHGCRFLQKQLDLDMANATPIFEETKMHVVELMVDPFGNYLVQKLLEKVNDRERLTLVENASSDLVPVALDPHGTRALQKLVELINSDAEAQLVVKALSKDVVSLSRDLNGNHGVQRCLQRLKSEDAQFIFDTAGENCLEIATHRHGCCVLQRCLDHGSKKQCESLAKIISQHTVELSMDAYGNYVVQYVLARDDEMVAKDIVTAIKENLITLSLHKFGSNVIEKCFKSTSHSGELIDELLRNESQFVNLLNDSFGNYVIQTALNVAKQDQFDKLSSALRPLLPQVRNTPHGRRILSRLQPSGKTPLHTQRTGAGATAAPATTA